MTWHILDRFIIHLFASTSLVTGAYFLTRSLQRRYPQRLPLIMAAVIVFALTSTREAVDVTNGQPLVKAFTDYLSWLLGTAGSCWLIYRIEKGV